MSIQRYRNGFSYFFYGFYLITRPRLRLFVLIPFLINTALFALFIIISKHYFAELTQWIDRFLPSWLLWLNIILWAFFVIGVGLVLVFAFTIIANFIAGPFNALLSQRVQYYLSHNNPPDSNWQSIPAESLRTVKREWLKFIYFLPRALICFVLYFVPLIQIIASFIWLLFNSWFLGLQYIDYPADNNKQSFNDLLQQMHKHRGDTLSFGFISMILSFIPIVNFIIMPAAVAGATAMWLDWQKAP